MTTTFANLIDEVFLTLEGWGLNQGRAAFINDTGGITASDLTITVDSGENLSAGLAEIDDELIYISDVTGTTVTIAPDGRGYRGTTAATHADDARITMNPVIPRVEVKRAINRTILGVYPTLRAVKSTEISPVGYTRAYEIPADCEQVLRLNYQASGPSGIWPKVTHYDVDLHADTDEFTTGKSLILIGPFELGRPVKLTYLARPSELSAASDDLADAGLEDTARACIVAGALWRLASTYPLSRIRNDSTATDFADVNGQSAAREAGQVGLLLRQQYEQELMEESRRQFLSHSVPIYHTE